MAEHRTIAANEDPVCGMTVDPEEARAKGLATTRTRTASTCSAARAASSSSATTRRRSSTPSTSPRCSGSRRSRTPSRRSRALAALLRVADGRLVHLQQRVGSGLVRQPRHEPLRRELRHPGDVHRVAEDAASSRREAHHLGSGRKDDAGRPTRRCRTGRRCRPRARPSPLVAPVFGGGRDVEGGIPGPPNAQEVVCSAGRRVPRAIRRPARSGERSHLREWRPRGHPRRPRSARPALQPLGYVTSTRSIGDVPPCRSNLNAWITPGRVSTRYIVRAVRDSSRVRWRSSGRRGPARSGPSRSRR